MELDQIMVLVVVFEWGPQMSAKSENTHSCFEAFAVKDLKRGRWGCAVFQPVLGGSLILVAGILIGLPDI